MRTCPTCGYINNTQQSKCRDCYNEYMRNYLRTRWEARRWKGIDLLGGKCVDCGSVEELQFDHIDPSRKSFTLGNQTTCSEAKFLKELAKCTLRCRPCHIERTREQQTVGHGGGLTGKHNCYCTMCKQKKTEYMRNWRSTHSRTNLTR